MTEQDRGQQILKTKEGQEIDVSSLAPIEILRLGIKTERVETILLADVDLDDAIVDTHHAADLNASMNESRGQLTPILVAAYEADGMVRHQIADGFHRAAGALVGGKDEIDANVMYGCDAAELQDKRILCVGSVRSVQFPRIARWMEESFATTIWSEKGISVSQAFAIVVNDSQRTRGIQLDPEDIEGLKAWVKEKCRLWGNKSPQSAYQILRLVSNADPELVKQVRNVGGGTDRKGVITAERLRSAVDAFPGKANFWLQGLLLREITNRRLSAANTEIFVRIFSLKHKPWMNESDCLQLLSTINIDALIEESLNLPDGSVRSLEPSKLIRIEPSNTMESRLYLPADRPSHRRTRKNNRTKRFYPDPDTHQANDQPSTPDRNNDNEEILSIAEKRIQTMQLQLNEQAGMIQELQNRLSALTWWNSQTGLGSRERACMDLIFINRLSVTETAEKLGISTQEVGSAVAKTLATNNKPKSPTKILP